MIVVTKNAEEKLLRALRAKQKEDSSGCCIYAAFSKTELPQSKLFDGLVTLLQEAPDSDDLQVYFCQDGDAFILSPDFSQAEFSALFVGLCQEFNDSELSKLAQIFDLKSDWSSLKALTTAKLNAVSSLESVAARAEKSAGEDSSCGAVSKVSPELAAGVHDRRARRDEPVVMIVDDDFLTRTVAGNVLCNDYSLIFAPDGQNALEEYVKHAPDVLFLDIGMPGMNGYEVLETLFEIDPGAYVIMFSGKKNKENTIKALRLGAQGFLGKPFTRAKLTLYAERSPYVQEKKQAMETRQRAAS